MPESKAFEHLLDSTLLRIQKITAVLAVVGLAPVWLILGTMAALAYVAGCLVSYLNFQWLSHAALAFTGEFAETVGDKYVVTTEESPSYKSPTEQDKKAAESAVAEGLGASNIHKPPKAKTGGIIVRFLLRYALLALIAYAMMKSSAGTVYGFLFGLFLSVAALFCEVGYQIYIGFRHNH